jgi:hypothetical protein
MVKKGHCITYTDTPVYFFSKHPARPGIKFAAVRRTEELRR